MSPNNNLNVLPWYTSLSQQNGNKWYAFGNVWPLVMPAGRLIPFQLVVPYTGVTVAGFSIINVETNGIYNGPTSSISLVSKSNYTVIKMSGGSVSPTRLGRYYAKLTLSNGKIYYSEVFTFVNNISDYIKLQYWNDDNLYYNGGEINYENNFKFEMYLCTTIGKPEYQFEEEVTKRLGYRFPELQISNKVYKFTFVAPEFICDALRLVRLSDYIHITSEDDTYNALSFAYEAKWETQGDLASVEAEFETDNIIQKLESFNRRVRDSFYNALLTDTDVPFKFDESSIAQYYKDYMLTAENSNFINGKLIRELVSGEAITDTTYIAVDYGTGAAKKLNLKTVLSSIDTGFNVDKMWEELGKDNASKLIHPSHLGLLHKLFTPLDKDGNEVAYNDNTTEIKSIRANYDFWGVGAVSAKGLSTGGGGGTGGIVQTVYGFTDLGGTFSDSDLNNTFNAYTINEIWKLANKGGLSDFSISGTGNAITNVEKAADGKSLVFKKDTIFATKAEFDTLNNKFNDFLTGADADNIINKWAELEVFLQGMKESDNLATILNGKMDKNALNRLFTALDAAGNEVDINDTTKTIATIRANYGLWSVDFVSAKGVSTGGGGTGGASALYQLADVLANADNTGVSGAAAGKALVFDGTHWKAGDAGLNESQLATYLTSNGYLKQATADGRYVTKVTDQTITGIKTFAHSQVDTITLRRTVSNGGAYVKYHANNNTAEYWRVGMLNTKDFLFEWGETYLVQINTAGTIMSKAAQGTKPIAVNSTTLCDNLNADLLDGLHISDGQKPWNAIVHVRVDGVAEMGRYIDFHYDNTTGSDYSCRLQVNGNNSNMVVLPSGSGTLARTVDNVASATKLQTARTIWGQLFDGTANVSGSMKDVSSINSGIYNRLRIGYNITDGGDVPWYGISFIASESEPITMSGYYGLKLRTNNGILRILRNGNVGIGTDTPSRKLHVNGDIQGSSIYATTALQVGDAYLKWDATNNAVYVVKKDGTTPAGFYATSFVSAKGVSTGGGSTSSNYLVDLLDTAISNPANGQALVYNSSTQKWVNGTIDSFNTNQMWAELARADASKVINISHIPEIEYIISKDTRNTETLPNTYKSSFRAEFKLNSTNGLNDGGLYNGILNFKSYGSITDFTGGYPHQLGFTENGNVWHRKATNSTTWGAWHKIITDANYSGVLDTRYVTLATTQTITSLKTFANSGIDAIILKRTTSPGGTHIRYYANNSDTEYWRVGMSDMKAFHFDWGSIRNAMTIDITGTIIIGAPQGTKPIGVTSTTLCDSLNADLLDGNHLSDIRSLGYAMQETIIDASSLNENTWYPVTIRLFPYRNNVRIEVLVSLDSGTKPSWAKHNGGFTVRVAWESAGNGRETNNVDTSRFVYFSEFRYCDISPVRGIGQMTNSSNEYVYVRGGGKYRLRTSHGVSTINLRTSTFTTDGETIGPQTIAPAEIVHTIAKISDNVASATKLQTARAINGTAFNGTVDITTSYWGTARNMYISDSGANYTGAATSVNGSGNVTLKLPSIARFNELHTTQPNGLRMVYDNYGAFFRNDGVIFYLMLTNSGNQYGNWNSFRPWYVEFSTGKTYVNGFLNGNASSATKLQTARSIWGQPFDGTSDVYGTFSLGYTRFKMSYTDSYIKLQSYGNVPLVINTEGNNVGIGTSAPSRKLHVNGDIQTSSIYATSWYRSTGNTGWYHQDYGGGWYMTDSTYIRNYNSKRLRIQTDTYDTIQVVRTSSAGGSSIAFYNGGGTYRGSIGCTANSWFSFDTGTATANQNVVEISTAGGIHSKAEITAKASGSDIRLKKDIQAFHAMGIIRKFRSVKYHWNDIAKANSEVYNNDYWQFGLIAQDLLAGGYEQWVRDVFHDYYTIAYERLIPVVWKGLQEVDSEVIRLRRRVEQLEREIYELKKTA